MKTTTENKPKIYIKNTATGKKPNKIEHKPKLNETVVFSWARMNPPTKGHEHLVNEMNYYDDDNHDKIIYLSHTENTKRNPLPYSVKLEYAKIAFGDIIQESETTDIVSSLKKLRENYKNIILMVGEDRVDEFNEMFMKYNDKDFHFENWTVVSCGLRNSQSNEIEGVSATALREAFIAQDFNTIRDMMPESLIEHAQEISNYINRLYSIEEAINVVQRLKRASMMKRYKQVLKTARARAMDKRASKKVIGKRARRSAIETLKKKLAGSQSISKLSDSEKARIENILAKRKGAIARLAGKLVNRIRQKENTRFANSQK